MFTMNKNKNFKTYLLILMIIISLSIGACSKTETRVYDNNFRLASIPADIAKISPETDIYPPILHSDEFSMPVPVEIISTAGIEDSPFIPADADELYFMFINDPREDPSEQVKDKVNGIWVSKLIEGKWAEPELVILQKENELALNGAEFVSGDKMMFVSAREGYTGLNWFEATRKNDTWEDWKLIEFYPPYDVGELHIYGDTIYFHAILECGKGDLDIWTSQIEGSTLSVPINIDSINTDGSEGWPYISRDGKELWFTGHHNGVAAVFRSMLTSSGWGQPELIVSQFAGEPTLDKEGNLYFAHHYFKDGVMQEADIYVAYRRK